MNNLRLRQGYILAIIIIGLLIGYGILRYPHIISEAGTECVKNRETKNKEKIDSKGALKKGATN